MKRTKKSAPMPEDDANADEYSHPGPSGDAPSVLVVEKVQSTRELMGVVLEQQYRAQTAATYEQALRRARATRFDGVVVSVNLRGTQAGIDLLEEFRSLDAYENVPIIVIIGPTLDVERERLAEAGADDFLRMPFVRSELIRVVGDHVQPEQEGSD